MPENVLYWIYDRTRTEGLYLKAPLAAFLKGSFGNVSETFGRACPLPEIDPPLRATGAALKEICV